MADHPSDPWQIVVIEGVLFFLGVSAVIGGAGLVFGAEGMAPSEWLKGVPLVSSWLVPGLVLGLGFGIGSLVAGLGMVRRWRWALLGFIERWTGQHWSWSATVVIGLAHIVWISLELIYLPEASWLQLIYGSVGIALVTMPWLASARRSLSAVA